MLITLLLLYLIVLINVYPHLNLLLVANLLVGIAVLVFSKRLLIFGTMYRMKLDALPQEFCLRLRNLLRVDINMKSVVFDADNNLFYRIS